MNQLSEKKINDHIKNQNYPKLTEDEVNALRAVAENLYSRTSSELEKSLELFKSIDSTLVKRRQKSFYLG